MLPKEPQRSPIVAVYRSQRRHSARARSQRRADVEYGHVMVSRDEKLRRGGDGKPRTIPVVRRAGFAVGFGFGIGKPRRLLRRVQRQHGVVTSPEIRTRADRPDVRQASRVRAERTRDDVATAAAADDDADATAELSSSRRVARARRRRPRTRRGARRRGRRPAAVVRSRRPRVFVVVVVVCTAVAFFRQPPMLSPTPRRGAVAAATAAVPSSAAAASAAPTAEVRVLGRVRPEVGPAMERDVRDPRGKRARTARGISYRGGRQDARTGAGVTKAHR